MIDKRKVSTDALETLGTLIGEGEKRDAIHLAVVPVVAGEPVLPGAHVELIDGTARLARAGAGIGIVDPFLTGLVLTGERFWLVIYPRKITSLRHVWTHPDLPEEGAPGMSREDAHNWLEYFLVNERLVSAKEANIIIEQMLHDSSDACFSFDISGQIPPKFYECLEIIGNQKIPRESRADWFSCSC